MNVEQFERFTDLLSDVVQRLADNAVELRIMNVHLDALTTRMNKHELRMEEVETIDRRLIRMEDRVSIVSKWLWGVATAVTLYVVNSITGLIGK